MGFWSWKLKKLSARNGHDAVSHTHTHIRTASQPCTVEHVPQNTIVCLCNAQTIVPTPLHYLHEQVVAWWPVLLSHRTRPLSRHQHVTLLVATYNIQSATSGLLFVFFLNFLIATCMFIQNVTRLVRNLGHVRSFGRVAGLQVVEPYTGVVIVFSYFFVFVKCVWNNMVGDVRDVFSPCTGSLARWRLQDARGSLVVVGKRGKAMNTGIGIGQGSSCW